MGLLPIWSQGRGRKVKCNYVQIITAIRLALSVSRWFSIVCLCLWGPVDTRHTVGAQRGADRVVPKSRLLTFATMCNPPTAQRGVRMASSSKEEAQRSQVTCP